MTAKIKSLKKELLPRFSATEDKDVITTMLVAEVDFLDTQGEVVHSQIYAKLPEEFDMEEFDRQAAAMQNDVDHLIANKEHNERNALADEVLAKFNLNVADTLPINETTSI